MTMLVKEGQRLNLKCENCIKPVMRRLALFQAKDEYECYAESYVKCFWGLCDMHRSNEDIIHAPDIKVVVTDQPRSQKLPYKNVRIMNDIAVKS
ncbi:hypothetical protein PYW08_011777 [Mythimna loreyi]|uniref:Uncharacterized protein n=1 Tax=Mythimna loreyi TaxID=667449 RepID=A0ACC2QMH7_9NEOP|nr:hypothetical protein PYW08_011777 [Mythimna loreyi]